MKDLIGIADLSRDEVEDILSVKLDGSTVRGGGAVGLVFHEPSTRTRFSFTQAVLRVGLTPVDLNPGSSSEQKGETTLDTCRNLEWAGARALVLRTRHNGLPAEVAKAVGIPVVNAGDGTNEHPTQALGDALTLWEHFGRVDGLTVAIVGDVASSRVARSNAHLLAKLGAKVQLVSGRPTDIPCSFWSNTLEHGLAGADAVMILRWQDERHVPASEEKRGLHVDEDVLLRYAPGAVVMHPGPVNRGVEVTSEVVDGTRSLVRSQVEHGVKARTKLLLHLLRRR
jgi:aspartate carbamoyltransferase catalytic subunit